MNKVLRYRYHFPTQLAFFAAAAGGLALVVSLDTADRILGVLLFSAGVFLLAGLRLRRPVRNIYILLGHPDIKSEHCRALADAYEQGAREAGFNVVRQNLARMKFDPVLHKGYRETQELETSLKKFQKNVEWADHLVIIYPNWWSSMPAQLKGLFDRAWLPGFAFNFTSNYNWQKLLQGRTGRIIVTLDSPPFLAYSLFGDYANGLQKAILEFAGVEPTQVTSVGGLKFLPRAWFRRQQRKVYRMGYRGL